MKQPWVCIILLNYNGYEDTIECLESLFKLEYKAFSLVVVDNNSTDSSLEKLTLWLEAQAAKTKTIIKVPFLKKVIYEEANGSLSEEKAWVTTIQVKENLGFAGGNNIGIAYAQRHFSPEYVWLLNNDTVVVPNSLSKLVQKAQEDLTLGRNIGIWGSKLLYYHKPDTIQAIGGKLNLTTFTTSHISEGLKDTPATEIEHPSQDYVVGASLFVSRKFLELVGLLSEEYFLYFEELDWAKRGLKAGFRLGYVPESKVYHKEGSSIGSSSTGKKKSDLADYHGIRSKIIFFRKFYPERTLQLYTILLGSVLLRLCRFQFKRAFRVLRLMCLIR
ncbi:hypothetical protein DC20_16770 [Rufibacter tibetensis]|uniref:Glycosyltransferase 2-like domain-containing protein n=1 Tax=Rufibacter tibetensis TaxID=512763 RepID=A0A0P0CCU4_9BACT|nr:hypothetical protein DC20_16770 [Rufibacter tibetensis]